MKTSRALSIYLIRDLARFSGMSFKHTDRLTQAEASQLAAWARGVPAVAAAYLDKRHAENGAVRLYANMLEHYLMDHPQSEAGDPAPWPDPKSSERAVAANPFGVSTAEEADAFLQWAQTVPEYRAAFTDPKHPQHADYVAQTLELRELAAPPAAAEAAQASPAPSLELESRERLDMLASVAARHVARETGLSPEQITERARADRDGSHRIQQLQRDPAYLDAKHPGHAAAVAAMARAYEARHPEPAAPVTFERAGGAARHTGGPAGVKELQADPAYLNPRDPRHSQVVEAVSQAYARSFPEAPQPAPVLGR